MTLDFVTQLHGFIEQLNLGLPVKVGTLDVEESISLYALPGGATARKFFDGVSDKLLNYEFGIKSKDQKIAIQTLDKIAHALHNAYIPSSNGSYDFRNIAIASEPFLVDGDAKGFKYYRLTITAELTIYEKRNDQ